MRLVTEVSISRLRSIREASLDGLQDFSALAGVNNSGKSNFLRALNLFFTGRLDPDTTFDINRDYYRPEIRAKKKKVIEIGVRFALPDNFKFRKGLEPVESLLGSEFKITKRWTRDTPSAEIILNDDTNPLGADDALKVQQFLGLITFRYIPNRVIPTDVIAEEHAALRDVLIRRLARYREQSEAVFEGIQTTAEAVISDMAKSVGNILPDVTRLRLDTATSLAELAFRFGYRLQEGSIDTEESEQGSGVQSLLMFQTLHLIDRDFFQRFGWRQAAIWAVEEPESSLHTGLEAEVARFLGNVMRDPGGRLQGLATTHSDLVIQYTDAAYLVEKRESVPGSYVASVAKRMSSRELLRESARHGISRWVNPILFFFVDPLVLVEGVTDREFIAQGLRLISGKDYHVAALADLLGVPQKGGLETVREFLRDNAEAIKSRPTTAPVVVVVDWDGARKQKEILKPFSHDDPIVVLAWAENEANPVLDKSFRGIERFFTTKRMQVVEKLHPDLIATKKNGTKTIAKDDYGRLKALLAEDVAKGLSPVDLEHAQPFLIRLQKELDI